MKILTIGFTKQPAEEFFAKLMKADVKTVVDVRLRNNGQFLSFTKRNHFEYFLRVIAGISYVHEESLAPDEDLYDDWKKERISWEEYQGRFIRLLEERRPDRQLKRSSLDGACLLCSEPTPSHCHRRLVAEYLREKWDDVDIVHL